MEEVFEITTAKQWKAFSHPLRLGILSLLKDGPMTNEELAKGLGVESGKLYFHTRQLLDAGMIERAGTREKGPITEKLYRAAAKRFYAPPPTLDGADAPFGDLVASALSLYRSAWEEDRVAAKTWQLGAHVVVAVPRATVIEITQELRAIVDRLLAENSDNPESDPVAVTLLLHSLSRSIFGRDAASAEDKS